ncbi:hypothetical protein [Nocardioides speluncae]|uniref:hypothetical protein n=1 Tax=Nocardioides speluncae TaxID=2670337 RepID=UPI000D68A753|nr:hypothetical protein [Nocardioides speluncae]
MAYDPTTPAGQVRLLINDTDDSDPVFSDEDITAFLTLEGDRVKRAAAQAIDTIADDEVLTSKVIRDHNLSTNGAAVAKELKERAKSLREQADEDDESVFEIIDLVGNDFPSTAWF